MLMLLTALKSNVNNKSVTPALSNSPWHVLISAELIHLPLCVNCLRLYPRNMPTGHANDDEDILKNFLQKFQGKLLRKIA